MKHFVNSANVGIKFRTGVPFFAENHCNLNNIFYFHSSKHFPFGNKPIKGLFLQIYLFPFKQEENAGFIFQKTIHKQATQSIRNKKGA